MMQSTKNTTRPYAGAEASFAFGITPRESTPLPRRWARAKAWSHDRAAGPPDVQHIKLMLRAERANRG